MIEYDIENEDLVYETLLTLKENEETSFRNFSLITSAIDILFIILRQHPSSSSKVNNMIRETLLKTWRSKQKLLAKTLSYLENISIKLDTSNENISYTIGTIGSGLNP